MESLRCIYVEVALFQIGRAIEQQYKRCSRLRDLSRQRVVCQLRLRMSLQISIEEVIWCGE
jgi:hypothetical protein